MNKIFSLKLMLILAFALAVFSGPSDRMLFAAPGDLASYKPVFDDLKNQINTGNYEWNGVQENTGQGGFTIKQYGYLLRDMDSDGVNELLLFADDSEYNEYKTDSLVAVFTIKNGKPEMLKEFWSRSRGYLTNSNYILNEASNGADDSSTDIYWYHDKSLLAMTEDDMINVRKTKYDFEVDESIEPLPIPDA